MGRYMKIIQLYLIVVAIAGCAKGGLTSSTRNKNIVQDNSPVQSLPVDEETSAPISDIDNPKNQPTAEPAAPTIKPEPKTEAKTTPEVKPMTQPKIEAAPKVAKKPIATQKKPVSKVPATPSKPVVSEPTKNEVFNFIPLIWEKTVKAAKEWSNMVYSIIKAEEPVLLGQNIADDIEIFCPAYRGLSDNERLNFWGQFFATVSFYESSWVPTKGMVETTMSIDPVTKKTVVSEGLLSLSYQDQRNYPFHCGFDWEKDSKLAANDPKKTILNPYLNLRCGIKIMSYQLQNRGRITLEKNVYWSVLKINGKYTKIREIAKKTRALKICQ